LNIFDNNTVFYFGRDEIQGCATKALPDLNAYNNISKVRKDGNGKVTKSHFLIHVDKNDISIEDITSTNGTYLGTMKLQGNPPQKLKEGDKVILPVEEFGKMVQLELIFHKK
jgi:pSer/pThr/pTyr-binding forkhead associated (FHA) protein